jgi:hypothetical protein
MASLEAMQAGAGFQPTSVVVPEHMLPVWADFVRVPAVSGDVNTLADAALVRAEDEEQSTASHNILSKVNTAAEYAGYGLLGAVPVAHYALEDPFFASLYNRFAEGGHNAPMSVVMLGLMAVEGFGFGYLANKSPLLSQRFNEAGEKPRSRIMQLGKTALDGVKKPIDWLSKGMERVGNKMGTRKNPVVHATGELLTDTSKVVGLGTPGAIVLEKNQTGKSLSNKRMAELAGLFAATWYPTFWAGKGVVYGTYDGLEALGNQGVPGADAVNTGVHDTFRTIGELLDVTRPTGQIFLGAAGALMMVSTVRAHHRNKKVVSTAEDLQQVADNY